MQTPCNHSHRRPHHISTTLSGVPSSLHVNFILTDAVRSGRRSVAGLLIKISLVLFFPGHPSQTDDSWRANSTSFLSSSAVSLRSTPCYPCLLLSPLLFNPLPRTFYTASPLLLAVYVSFPSLFDFLISLSSRSLSLDFHANLLPFVLRSALFPHGRGCKCGKNSALREYRKTRAINFKSELVTPAEDSD